MLVSMIIIIISVVIAAKELPRFKQSSSRNDAIAFTIMLLVGTVCSLLAVHTTKNISPLQVIEFIYRPISQLFIG
ncbi:hypothetical protein BRE01_36750 [Brevibacillus reuszeri]|uniref:Uncharacterized protein n=1 Tax=Brevibacillus reuszeri TaxID=54915 RepID=A0A0K9YPE5_9BACL|nr:hypothetical protein ADS79_16960 [Brevibacillus reuszeri]GED69973.1 hypothetical protein BRE01_36750 [Brevibacillus reuszeri]